MQLNKLVGAIRAKMDWHAVEDVMVGDSQIARVRYWLNNDPERGKVGFVAEQWCFDDQMWLIIGDQYGTPDEAKAACEQHVTCLLLGMVEMDDALTQTHMRIGNTTFHPNVMVQSVLDCAAREYERRKDEKGDTSGLQALRDDLKAKAKAGGLQPPEVQGFVQGSAEWQEAIEAINDQDWLRKLWAYLPKEAKYIAKDGANELWWAYINKPELSDHPKGWLQGGIVCKLDFTLAGLREPKIDWKHSLMQRPEGM